MQKVVQKAHAQGFEVLLPYPHIPEDEDPYSGTGLYPDRMILETTRERDKDIQTIIQDALEELAQLIAAHLGDEESSVHTYLRQYLQTYLIRLQTDAPPNKVIFDINALLDTAELQNRFIPKVAASQDYLFRFFDQINTASDKDNNQILTLAFGEKEKTQRRVRSIAEIATAGLEKVFPSFQDRVARLWWQEQIKKQRSQGEQADEEDLYDYLLRKSRTPTPREAEPYRDLAENLRMYHRYIAVVHADGDNVGAAIKQLDAKEKVSDFSEKLLRFGLEASRMVRAFGGQLVFAGGDDLLFFAPVMYGEESIFSLCDALNDLFQNKIRVPSDTGKKPSLSFGISISYHKFPLYEALETARDLLFAQAKQFPDPINPDKNAIAFKLLKHSGQHFGQVFSREYKTYTLFKELLHRSLKDPGRFLSSVMFLLDEQKAIFDQLGQLERLPQGVTVAQEGTRFSRIQTFFDNQFDEAPHQGEGAEYLQDVQLLISEAYEDYPDGDEARKAVYSALRTIHFLNQPHDA